MEPNNQLPAYRLEGVRYGDILDLPELFIPEGLVTCIVGESGSGKTTLLRLLNHLISPDAGAIYYFGQNLLALDPVNLRREAVMLGQNPLVFTGTLAENLQLGRDFAGLEPAPEEMLQETLRRVHLEKDLQQTASTLSGGERQRLALGRVLLLKPRVLLLDEPSAALDEDTEEVVMDDLLAYAAEEASTLVLVTHNRALAQRVADYLVTLHAGKLQAREEVSPA